MRKVNRLIKSIKRGLSGIIPDNPLFLYLMTIHELIEAISFFTCVNENIFCLSISI